MVRKIDMRETRGYEYSVNISKAELLSIISIMDEMDETLISLNFVDENIATGMYVRKTGFENMDDLESHIRVPYDPDHPA